MTDDAAWVRLLDGSVLQIDLASGEVLRAIPVGTGEFGDVAAGDEAIWVTTFDENTVTRIDPLSGEIVAVVEVGENPEGVLVSDDAVWVSNHRDGSLSRIDPLTNLVVATVRVGPEGTSGPSSLALVADDLWTAVPNANGVVRVDPTANEVVGKTDVNFITWLVGAKDIYAVSTTVGRVSTIDPESAAVVGTAQLTTFPLDYGAGGLWSVDAENLLRLDESTLEPAASYRISASPTSVSDLAFTSDSVWLLLPEQETLIEVTP